MILKNKTISVGIWSEDYKKLAQWYMDVLNFKFKESAELPNDSYVAFDFGANWLWIGKHSQVRGKAKDPFRIMVEFQVESVMSTYEELKAKNVTMIAEPFSEPTGTGNWCMTISDPEGNIIQFYGKK